MQISYETFIAIIKPSGLHSVGLHAIPAVHRKTVQFSNSIATNSPVARLSLTVLICTTHSRHMCTRHDRHMCTRRDRLHVYQA